MTGKQQVKSKKTSQLSSWIVISEPAWSRAYKSFADLNSFFFLNHYEICFRFFCFRGTLCNKRNHDFYFLIHPHFQQMDISAINDDKIVIYINCQLANIKRVGIYLEFTNGLWGRTVEPSKIAYMDNNQILLYTLTVDFLFILLLSIRLTRMYH